MFSKMMLLISFFLDGCSLDVPWSSTSVPTEAVAPVLVWLFDKFVKKC